MTTTTKILIYLLLFLTFSVKSQYVDLINQSLPSCNGACDGSTTFSVVGVTGPYSVIVSNTTCPTSNTINFSSSTITINNLCKCDSAYNFTFLDNASSLIETKTISINPLQLAVFATNSPISCANACDATATVTAVNGTPPISYTWSPLGIVSQTISNACPTSYTIDAVDANGCKGSAHLIILNWGPCAGINELNINEHLDVFPNPAIDFINIYSDENIELTSKTTIQNLIGQTVIETDNIREINISNLTPGLYNLRVITQNKTYYSKFIKE